MKILVVFPHQELAQAQLVETNVRKALGDVSSTVVDLAKNEKDAHRLFHAKDYNLLIIALNIPKTSETPLNTEEAGGLTFLRTLRDSGSRKPSIVITDDMDRETFSKIQELESCVPLLRGKQDWEVILNSRVRQQLGLSDVKQREKTCWVDIRLDLENRRGDYRIKGTFSHNAYMGVLEQLDFRHLKQLVVDSRAVGRVETPDWIELFHNIGERLLEELFRKNYQFIRDFSRAVPALGSDDESVRIRFVVANSVHPLAFEALIDDDATYRMLRSPVYRKIESGSGAALFGEENQAPFFAEGNEAHEWPIRSCLIIVAETAGLVTGLSSGPSAHILRPLKHVDDEGKRLEKYLTSKGVMVSRLGGSSVNPASTRNVKDALKSGPWDAVHFAGHSFWDERGSGRAVIFLPGEIEPQFLDIEPLAVHLRNARTRFVYLSSCSSSGCGVELARKQISSIIGYRWDIDDELAVEHAECFYSNMFEHPRSLEIAFLRTRQEMYERHRDNRIWASSVLIKQTEID